MKLKPQDNPYYCKPDHPNYLQRSWSHDYCRPARYLITVHKNPAVPAFCTIDGSSDAPCVRLTRTGELFEEALAAWLEKFQQIAVQEHIIMPDHIHLCVWVMEYLPCGLSRAVGSLKGLTSRLRHNALVDYFRTERSATPPSLLSANEPVRVFTKGFNDRIAYDNDQWLRQNEYTIDNPRRYLLKREHPDYLLQRWAMTIDGNEYMLIGNIFLLNAPHLFAVKYSSKFTLTQVNEFIRHSKALVDNCAVGISPFIHPKEREIRDYAVQRGFSFIRICDNGFLHRQYPSGTDFQLVSAGRLLLISPMGHESQRREMRYEYASRLNVLAARIAELCNSGAVPRLRLLQ